MMLTDGELLNIYNNSSFNLADNRGVREVANAVALRIADDMDFWNSIHDADNQADSDWIRQRYGAGSQAGLDG